MCGLKTTGIVLCVSEVFEDSGNKMPKQEVKVSFFFLSTPDFFPNLNYCEHIPRFPQNIFADILTHNFVHMYAHTHPFLFKKEITQNKLHYTQYFVPYVFHLRL